MARISSVYVLASVERAWGPAGDGGKSEKKRVNDDVSDVAHERPFIRPRRYLLGKECETARSRGKEGRPDEDYVICI